MPVPDADPQDRARSASTTRRVAFVDSGLGLVGYADALHSLRPDLGEVLAAGMEYGALGGIVSGSGPTMAFLVEDNEAGIDLAVALTASGVVRDVRRASGPVHGAHVIHHRVD